MTHVLVKWLSEESWDVYPVRAIKTTNIALQLLSEDGIIKKLRGRLVVVDWAPSEQPAEAKLLDFGSQKAMELKRARLAKAATAKNRSADAPAGNHAELRNGSDCHCNSSERIRELEDQVRELEQKLQEANNNYDSLIMVKKSRKLVRKLESLLEQPMEPHVHAEKVNIGDGVLVEKTVLDRLHTHCHGLPTKFARNLVRHLFTEEELKGKSLYGRGSNKHKEVAVKEALDPVRLNAVIGYTCSKYSTSTVQLKSSLSSMLSREIK
ncbi:hypothetical protein MTO96_007731 [Rhipicephalus appendiculatus]